MSDDIVRQALGRAAYPISSKRDAIWPDVRDAALAYARCCADQEEWRRQWPDSEDEVIQNIWRLKWRALRRDTAIKAQAVLSEAKRLEDRLTGPEVVK